MSTGSDPTSPGALSPSGRFPAVDTRSGDGDQEGLLDVLKMLLETGKAKTVQDLIRYADQSRAPRSAERLRMLAAEGVPVDLAFDAISVEIRILAHKKNSSLLKECRGKKVAVVIPVPPYVLDLFMSIAEVELLSPSEHHLPGHLHQYLDRIRQGMRACRQATESVDVVVFEAYREGEQLFVDPAVADFADTRVLPPAARLILHLRPHQNPEDVPYIPGRATSFV
jgi:hypothetical protein